MDFFDFHADTPLVLASDNPLVSAVDMITSPFERYIQTFAIYLSDGEKSPFETYKKRLNLSKKFCEENNIPILTEIKNVKKGVILSVENCGFLAENPDFLNMIYNDGVRILSLSWNGKNQLACGSDFNGPLTKKGKDIIKRMNGLGMLVDVSHLSHKSSVMAISEADRVIATHSCCDSIFHHKRNLRDEELNLIKQKNGIVGLCFYPEFLGTEDVYGALLKNVNYLLDLGMEKNIAFGSDFDGAKMSPKLSKTKDIPTLYNKFIKLGLKKSLVDAIFYQNALAFFCKMCENN